MPDYVHMCISIPLMYAVAHMVEYIKSAIQVAWRHGVKKRNFTVEQFWARRYFVSMVGLDDAVVRAYIRNH